jgi:predicted transcriptional regulator
MPASPEKAGKGGLHVTNQAAHKTVRDVFSTHSIRVRPTTNAKYVAVTLLSSHVTGAPVIDEKGRYLGYISEFDVLRALRDGKDLELLAAKDIMTTHRHIIHESTRIEDVLEFMEDKHLLTVPVEADGLITRTITRHDVLRTWLGVNISIDL